MLSFIIIILMALLFNLSSQTFKFLQSRSNLMFCHTQNFPNWTFNISKLISIIPSLKNWRVFWLIFFILLPTVNEKSGCFIIFCQIFFFSLIKHFLAISSAATLTCNPSILTRIYAQNNNLFSCLWCSLS